MRAFPSVGQYAQQQVALSMRLLPRRPVWSSWAWTAAFAHAVRRCFNDAIAAHRFDRIGRLDSLELRKERRWHVANWVSVDNLNDF